MDRFILYFDETQKGVILSRTLAEQIASILHSDDTEEWIGKKIMLFPQPLTVAGKSRIAIRAKKPAQVWLFLRFSEKTNHKIERPPSRVN